MALLLFYPETPPCFFFLPCLTIFHQTTKKFANEWNFEHDTSSPQYPQITGLVERTIQTVKRTLKKAHKSGSDPHLAILALRTAPLKNGSSPATNL